MLKQKCTQEQPKTLTEIPKKQTNIKKQKNKKNKKHKKQKNKKTIGADGRHEPKH